MCRAAEWKVVELVVEHVSDQATGSMAGAGAQTSC